MGHSYINVRKGICVSVYLCVTVISAGKSERSFWKWKDISNNKTSIIFLLDCIWLNNCFYESFAVQLITRNKEIINQESNQTNVFILSSQYKEVYMIQKKYFLKSFSIYEGMPDPLVIILMFSHWKTDFFWEACWLRNFHCLFFMRLKWILYKSSLGIFHFNFIIFFIYSYS